MRKSKIISLLSITVLSMLINFQALTKVYQQKRVISKIETEKQLLTEDYVAAQDYISHLMFTIERNKELTAMLSKMPGSTMVRLKPKYSMETDSTCLALLVFYEEGMGNDKDIVAIANTVYNRVKAPNFKNDTCSVIIEGKGIQFSSMGQFVSLVNKAKSGSMEDYIPKSVRKDIIALTKWNHIHELVRSLYGEGLPLYTEATHFVSVKRLKRTPNWLRHLRPVDVTTGHFLLVDHEYHNGKRVIYTKERPFNQAKYNTKKGSYNVHELTRILEN